MPRRCIFLGFITVVIRISLGNIIYSFPFNLSEFDNWAERLIKRHQHHIKSWLFNMLIFLLFYFCHWYFRTLKYLFSICCTKLDSENLFFFFSFRAIDRQMLNSSGPVEQKKYLCSTENEEGLIDHRVLKQKWVDNAFTRFSFLKLHKHFLL